MRRPPETAMIRISAVTPDNRREAPLAWSAVESAIETRDQPADPGHRMADGAHDALGIADRCFDQQGD